MSDIIYEILKPYGPYDFAMMMLYIVEAPFWVLLILRGLGLKPKGFLGKEIRLSKAKRG